MLEQHVCWVPICDTCGEHVEDEQGIPHYDTPTHARASLADLDLIQPDSGEGIHCAPCVRAARCARTGHHYGPWRPLSSGQCRYCQHCFCLDTRPTPPEEAA